MKSVHRFLLLTLIGSLIAGSLLTAVLVYWNARGEIDELYNKNMQEVALLLQHEIGESKQLSETPVNDTDKSLKDEEDMLIQIWHPDGQLLYSSHPLIPLPQQSGTGQLTAEFEGARWHVYRTDARNTILQIAQPYQARSLFVREMAINMLYPMLAQIPLISLFIWLAVGKSLMPLRRISRAIQSRSATSLIPVATADIPLELQPMVSELNALLGRLDMALAAQQRFTIDAAHELRTPLAAIKLQLGNLERAQGVTDRLLALNKLHRGVDRASHLVQQLLVFARLEPENSMKQHERIDLVSMIQQAVEAHAEIAYSKNIDLGIARVENAMVKGNAGQLRMAFDNLIDNAIRYTPSGGKIDVSTYSRGDEAVFEIKDSGIGISQDHHEKIFERFYRVTGTETDGTGLGLAIVTNIVEVHQGRILITDGLENKGIGFTVVLPLRD